MSYAGMSLVNFPFIFTFSWVFGVFSFGLFLLDRMIAFHFAILKQFFFPWAVAGQFGKGDLSLCMWHVYSFWPHISTGSWLNRTPESSLG